MKHYLIEIWEFLDIPEGSEKITKSLDDFIKEKLADSDDYEGGELENIKANLNMLNGFFSKFIIMQYQKGLITKEEILELLNIYIDKDEEYNIIENI